MYEGGANRPSCEWEQATENNTDKIQFFGELDVPAEQID